MGSSFSTACALGMGVLLAHAGCAGDSAGSGGDATAASSSAVGTSNSSTGETTTSSGAGGGPVPPADLVHYQLGDPSDARVTPVGPLVFLGGGGPDVDAAMAQFLAAAGGGDVVVLRTSGADGYNPYFFDDLGGIDSVETMLVTTAALANDPYVVDRLRGAEAIFVAGGDQAEYLLAWEGSGVEAELQAAWGRGAAIGGTSAGTAILGSVVFSAESGTVYSDEALADPYNPYMTLEYDFLALPALAGVVTDTHFRERDRMGRLVAFVGRAIADGRRTNVLGLGIDEGTALVVDAGGLGTVFGAGSVYAVLDAGMPQTISPGSALEYQGLPLHTLTAGDTISLPMGATTVPAGTVSASGGATVPAIPY